MKGAETLGQGQPSSVKQSTSAADRAALENIQILNRNTRPGLRKQLKIKMNKPVLEDHETEETDLPHCMPPKSETARAPFKDGPANHYFSQGLDWLDQE